MGNDKQGSCYCGDIGYEISGEPLTCYACHCSECQTKTGGAFALTIVLPETSLSLTKGEPREWLDDRGDSQVLTRLCGNCGGHLWFTFSVAPGVVFVRPGTLADTSWVKPAAHFWTRSKQPWVELDSESVLFETQPEDLSQLLEM